MTCLKPPPPPRGLQLSLLPRSSPVLHLLGSTVAAGGVGATGDVCSCTSAQGRYVGSYLQKTAVAAMLSVNELILTFL